MKPWLVGAGVALLGVACSDDEKIGKPSQVNTGHDGGASSGGRDDGGFAPDVPTCTDGLQRLRVVSDIVGALDPRISGYATTWVAAMVAVADAERVAVSLYDSIGIFDVTSASDEGSVHLVDWLTLENAGLPADAGFVHLFRDGEGLLVYARRGQAEDHGVLLSWQPHGGFEELTTTPSDVGFSTGVIADAEHGIVVGTHDGMFRGQARDAEWTWDSIGTLGGRGATPLAFDGEELLVGVAETYSGLVDGSGGEGGVGAGGPGGGPGWIPARVERWSLNGDRLASHETLGNPSVAVPARGGWLIAQTNSFWGSYQAAVDWLDPAGELVRLARVPVVSSSDGTDGAFDVAAHGEDLLVANCESGLRRGRWGDAAVTLNAVPGPWSPDFARCNPSKLEVAGDVLVVGGERLDFARFCEQANGSE